ncbi:MAG: DUF4474 domain-containing protein [Clostridiales bacterium]|nr:DUF4474 domain-containing protein [Clostridiales bacterium]
MKKFRLVISLLLVISVAAGLSAPAFADGIQDDVSPVAATASDALPVSPTDAAPDSPTDAAPAEEAPVNVPGYKSENRPIRNKIYDEGIPTITTTSFFNFFNSIRNVFSILSGKYFFSPPKKLNVTTDEGIDELTSFINENSGLDINQILTNVPDWNDPAKIVGKIININVPELRSQLYAAEQDAYASGRRARGTMCHFLASYLSVIERADIYLAPYGDDGLYEVNCNVTYSDGYVETFHPGIVVNPETGECTGKGDGGMVGIGFNCNVYDMLVYAPMYCWMRECGFCVEYDLLCYILPMYCYNTRRFRFDYADKEWMIQVWKGNYLITNGAEVGIYNRDKLAFGTYYNCITDEERLPMDLQVYHGNDLLVDIPETVHWWVNGFRMGKALYSPHSMTIKFSITFNDEEMLKAFCRSVDLELHGDVKYTVNGMKVSCVWDG